MLSCFPVVADPSTLEQCRVPFPLAKRVAELVFPLVVHTPKSLELALNAYFPDLCLEGQNLSSHYGQNTCSFGQGTTLVAGGKRECYKDAKKLPKKCSPYEKLITVYAKKQMPKTKC